MDDNMPAFNKIDWSRQELEDDAAMQGIFDRDASGQEQQVDLNPDREVDPNEEKAVDAVDFAEISDDDLPDEEDPTNPEGEVPGLTDDQGTSHDTDDLFGEGADSSPFDDFGDVFPQQAPDTNEDLSAARLLELRELNFPEYSRHVNQDPSIPAPAQSEKELVKILWPKFDNGLLVNFNDLLPPKKAHYIPKVPAKPPKPVAPTKVSLDLALDQEKLFRAAGPAQSNKRKRVLEAEAKGWVAIIDDTSDTQSDAEDFDFSPPIQEDIGGVSWAKLETLCADWDTMVGQEYLKEGVVEEDEPMDEWERQILGHSAKRSKATYQEPDYFAIPQFDVPASFDNFEKDTARLAKRVILDENDPYLLLERVEPELQHAPKRQRFAEGYARRGGGLNASLKSRFNYSNDEAYDALKENHQNKVRATLGHETIEHSLPALRLQWPYYSTRLTAKEARTHHRPVTQFKEFQTITFAPLGFRKKKTTTNLPSQSIFKECKDLSLADNSTATLLEYCEEFPMVLSNFGMGNRILNYYRRKDNQDAHRPHFDDKVGDSHVLLPEDTSPFGRFGHVEPGETIRSISNAMYKAPIFKHPCKSNDFLIVRDITAATGASWHIRNIDNLFVVGQQLPSNVIPGPSSRLHTNVGKNRMRMIATRLMKHNPNHSTKISQITRHFPDTSDVQTRQRLKDVIYYDKVDKSYKTGPGEDIPDEATIRSWVRPEDVCGIDAMQVGCQHLKDTGHQVKGLLGDDEKGVDKVKYESLTLEEKLAPWHASKAFVECNEKRAMLELMGDGDPTGCGLGISPVRCSMKGGYQGGPNSTSNAAMSAAEKKANGGHSYNVKKQEEAFTADIELIWNKQKADLSSIIEPAEHEMDLDDENDGHAGLNDDTASQFGASSEQGTHVLRIVRKGKPNAYGQVDELVDYIRDPQVIKAYIKKRFYEDNKGKTIYTMQLTGNPIIDKIIQKETQAELDRLERNKERRLAREKQKTGGKRASTIDPEAAGSPSAAPTPSVEKPATGGTTRKCANCGQMGHIKTNKKLCPMLNGTQGPVDSASQGGFGAISAPSFN